MRGHSGGSERRTARYYLRAYGLCALMLLMIGAICVGLGTARHESGPYTCDSTIMSPGDVCDVMISNQDGDPARQTEKTYTYDDMVRARAKANAARSNTPLVISGRVLGYAGLAIALLGAGVWARDRRRRRLSTRS